jgi:hypothetical protein
MKTNYIFQLNRARMAVLRIMPNGYRENATVKLRRPEMLPTVTQTVWLMVAI